MSESVLIGKIKKALALGGDSVSIEDLVVAAEAGRVRVWHGDQSILVGGMHNGKLVFHVAAGNLDEVLDLLPRAYEWGREQGADTAVFSGRRGWLKPLSADGWVARKKLLLFERSL